MFLCSYNGTGIPTQWLLGTCHYLNTLKKTFLHIIVWSILVNQTCHTWPKTFISAAQLSFEGTTKITPVLKPAYKKFKIGGDIKWPDNLCHNNLVLLLYIVSLENQILYLMVCCFQTIFFGCTFKTELGLHCWRFVPRNGVIRVNPGPKQLINSLPKQ